LRFFCGEATALHAEFECAEVSSWAPRTSPDSARAGLGGCWPATAPLL